MPFVAYELWIYTVFYMNYFRSRNNYKMARLDLSIISTFFDKSIVS